MKLWTDRAMAEYEKSPPSRGAWIEIRKSC